METSGDRGDYKREIRHAWREAEKSVQSLGGKLQWVKGIAEQVKTAFSGFHEKLSTGGTEKFNASMQDLIDGMQQAKYTINSMESGKKAFD